MENNRGIRIVEIPSMKMATSGNGSLDSAQIRSFEKWFSSRPVTLTPQDFMYFDAAQGNMVWLYALTDERIDTQAFEVIDFTGGLYAAAISVDNIDGEQVYADVLAWIEGGGVFEADEGTRNTMFHVPTPKAAQGPLGYCQLDIFVPIRVK